MLISFCSFVASGGVEWLQIKDRDFSYSRPNTICSFLHEQEDAEESAQAQEKLTEEAEGEVSDRGSSDLNCDPEQPRGLEADASSVPVPDSPASEAADSPSGSAALDDAPPWCRISSLQDVFTELMGQGHDFYFTWGVCSGGKNWHGVLVHSFRVLGGAWVVFLCFLMLIGNVCISTSKLTKRKQLHNNEIKRTLPLKNTAVLCIL